MTSIEQKRIRILVADDHTLVRQGIVRIIREEPDMEVVGEAGDGLETVAEAVRLRPDVILLDIGMPRLSGIEAARQIAQIDARIRILMLTVYDEEGFLFEALRAGASGYLLKGADVDELVSAVRSAHAGDVFIHARMTTKLVGEYLSRVASTGGSEAYRSLTPREKELLPLLAGDRSNSEIAALLYLSPHTVGTYRQRVMQKLDLHSKTELLRYALRRGIISLDK